MGPDQPVAVGFDDSDGARAALRHASAFASALDAELVLLYAVDSPQMVRAHTDDRAVSPAHARELVDAQRADAEARLEREVDRLRRTGLPSVRFEVLEGRPGSAISDRATELGCSLVAMGTRGRSGFVRAVLGSVADHVAHHAGCPVLLVVADPDDRSSEDTRTDPVREG